MCASISSSRFEFNMVAEQWTNAATSNQETYVDEFGVVWVKDPPAQAGGGQGLPQVGLQQGGLVRAFRGRCWSCNQIGHRARNCQLQGALSTRGTFANLLEIENWCKDHFFRIQEAFKKHRGRIDNLDHSASSAINHEVHAQVSERFAMHFKGFGKISKSRSSTTSKKASGG